MTGTGADGPLPEVRARDFGRDGTPGADYAAGGGPASKLFPRRARVRPGPGARRPGRLPAEGFRVSSPDARDRLERVLAGDGVCVTTGQQPLLFLGPLFVLYKALGAMELARRLEAAGTPALPVFWVGADDHDWPEVGRTRLLDRGNDLRTLRLGPPEGREGRAAGPTPLPDDVNALLDELTEVLPSSEFVDRYLECLRGAYRPGATVAEAFGDALQGVLSGRPFAWVDSAAPAVRTAAAPLADRVLADPAAAEARLRRGHRRVEEAGYEPQMPHAEGGLPLFLDRPEGRTRLFCGDGEGIRIGREGETVSAERLRAELERAPGRFSPHAALRPVQEAWLMPVGASVLGPSEVSYWAQLPPLFDWAGVEVPGIWPRPSWTLVEDKVTKVLRKLDADPADLRDGGDELARAVTERGRPDAVSEALAEAREQVGAVFGRVEDAVASELPGIRSAVGAARHEAFEALQGLGDAVDDRVREREEVLLSQIEKAAVHLYPRGEPQERVQSPFYYLARYGPGLLGRLEERTSAWADLGDGGDAGAP